MQAVVDEIGERYAWIEWFMGCIALGFGGGAGSSGSAMAQEAQEEPHPHWQDEWLFWREKG